MPAKATQGTDAKTATDSSSVAGAKPAEGQPPESPTGDTPDFKALINAKYGDGDEPIEGESPTPDPSTVETVQEEPVLDPEGNATDQTVEEPEAPAADDKPDPTKDVPFHDHPRWKEVLSERDTFKREVQETKPLAQRMKVIDEFSQQHGITPEVHKQALEIAALSVSNPAQYVTVLRQLLQHAESRTGDRLPDDLQRHAEAIQRKVTDGMLDEETANITLNSLREAAKTRATLQERENHNRVSTQQQVNQRKQEVVSTLNAWGATKQASDPGFKPGSERFDLTSMKLEQLLNAKGQSIASTQELITLAEEAYAYARKTLAPRTPVRPNGRVPVANGSSANLNPQFVLKADMSNLRDLVGKVADGTIRVS